MPQRYKNSLIIHGIYIFFCDSASYKANLDKFVMQLVEIGGGWHTERRTKNEESNSEEIRVDKADKESCMMADKKENATNCIHLSDINKKNCTFARCLQENKFFFET